MFFNAEADHVPLYVYSAYRSYNTQEALKGAYRRTYTPFQPIRVIRNTNWAQPLTSSQKVLGANSLDLTKNQRTHGTKNMRTNAVLRFHLHMTIVFTYLSPGTGVLWAQSSRRTCTTPTKTGTILISELLIRVWFQCLATRQRVPP